MKRIKWLGWSGAIAAFWLLLLAVAGLVGPWLPFERGQNLKQIRQGPTWAHPLGTDGRGVDMMVDIIDGARTSLLVGVLGALIGVSIGGAFGILIGYRRGRFDRVGTVVLDVLAAFPAYVAALTATLLFKPSVRTIVLILGVLTIPVFARVARSITLPIAEGDFVHAARMIGARHRRVVVRDLVPNVMVPIVSYSFVAIGIIIALEGALSFIGAGVPEGVQSWGKLIAAGQERVRDTPHLALVPATAILLTVLALNTVSERWNQKWLFGGRPPKPATAPRRSNVARVSVELDQFGERSGLVVENLHTWLDTPFGIVKAVNGVDLELCSGEMTALVGESGSGKTMLGRSIMGLVSAPQVADQPGRIMWNGLDLRTLDDPSLDRIRGRRIAMVLQDPLTSLDPVQRIGRQITEPLRCHFDMTSDAAAEEGARLLAAVGIADPERRMRAYPHELSGGLRQRVAIAIALSCDPDVLIADEPTSSLDVTVQAQLLALLDDLRRERRLAVLLITHDIGIVAGYADSVAVMYAGRIVEQGKTVDVLTSPRMPYTKALLEAVPRLDHPSHAQLRTIGGQPPLLIGDWPGCSFAPRCSRVAAECGQRPELAAGPDGNGRRVACWHPLEVAS